MRDHVRLGWDLVCTRPSHDVNRRLTTTKANCRQHWHTDSISHLLYVCIMLIQIQGAQLVLLIDDIIIVLFLRPLIMGILR